MLRCRIAINVARVLFLTLSAVAMTTQEAFELPGLETIDSVVGARSTNITVVPLAQQRRLRGRDSLPPFILRLTRVHLHSAQGSDRFRGYVTSIVHAIAKSLTLRVSMVEPVALLVYRDLAKTGNFLNERDYGNVVLLFRITLDCADQTDLCAERHKAWSQAWRAVVSDANSTMATTFVDEVDVAFPHELTPALCVKWEIRGPGCASRQNYTMRQYEEAEGLPLWFVMGVATMAVLMCALYPVSRIIKVQRRGRQLPAASGGSYSDTVKPDLAKLKRERVSVDSLGEDATCPICLAKPSDEMSEEILIAPCKHCMHVACAEAWFAKHVQCPLCRMCFKADECKIVQLEEGDEIGHRATSCSLGSTEESFAPTCSLDSLSTEELEESEGRPLPTTEPTTEPSVIGGATPNLIGSPQPTTEAERGDETNDVAVENREQRDPLPPLGNPSELPVDTSMPDPRSSLMHVSVHV